MSSVRMIIHTTKERACSVLPNILIEVVVATGVFVDER
jgi:hypothetical protein